MNTRPTPSVVTDDGLVERRVAGAIRDEAVAYGITLQPATYREIARAALAASDRDVLVRENARMRETLKGIERIAENHTGISGARSLQTAMHAISHAARAALIPLAEEL